MESVAVLYLLVEYFLMTSALKSNTFVFSGPKMCELHCQRTVGCFSFQYSTKYLSCILQPTDSTSNDGGFRKFQMKNKMVKDAAADKLNCSPFSKKFLSHMKILKCRITSPFRTSKHEMHGRGKHAKLWVYRGHSTPNITEIFLNNYTFHSIEDKFEDNIVSLDYVPSVKKLLIIRVPKDLFLLDIFNDQKSIKIDTQVICVTGADNDIFYLKFMKLMARLIRMTTTGRDRLMQFNANVASMDADRTRQFVYILSGRIVHKLTYQGKRIKKIAVGSVIFCLQPNGDFLFYRINSPIEIFKLTLSGDTEILLVKFNSTSRITTISFWDQTLYAVTKDCHVLYFGPKGSGKIKLNSSSKKVCFGCLITPD